MAATIIFPFVFRLVNETKVTKGNEDRTGYYTGITVRSFLFPLDLSICYRRSISTGVDILSCRDSLRLAMGETIREDRLYTSRFDWAIGPHALDTLLWSSRSFHAPVASRTFVGLLNDNVGVLKSMLGEITDNTNAAQGFAFLPIVWSAGSTIGCIFPRPNKDIHANLTISPLL